MTTDIRTPLTRRMAAALKQFELFPTVRDHRYDVELDALCDTCWSKVMVDRESRRFWQAETWSGLCDACEDVTEFLSSQPDDSPYFIGEYPLSSGDVKWNADTRTYVFVQDVQS